MLDTHSTASRRRSSARKPRYVSTSTTNAALYINGVLSSRQACTSSAVCTFTWAADSGTDIFAAEIDDGNGPGPTQGNVLGEGSATYTLNPGDNGALAPLVVNGVASKLGGFSNPETASGTATLSGTFTIADYDGNAITNTGASTVYDNGSPTFTSSNTTVGTVTISSTLKPDASGTDYPYSVSCKSGQTGSFNIVGTTGTASGDVSTANLSSNGNLAYPGTATGGAVYTYTCTSGVISDASGTITIGAIGTIAEFTIPTSNSGPQPIATGPDGALWFGEENTNSIGRVTTAGTFSQYAVPTPSGSGGTAIGSIAPGPDGALWFTEFNANQIGRITTTGSITEYPIPTGGPGPTGIVAGPDGALWFTVDSCTPEIGRITTSGAITEYPIPNSPSCPGDWQIAVGSDGNLWFTEINTGNQIGRVTTAGVFTLFSSGITGTAYPAWIAAGPDGNLWFTETNGNRIGRITTAGTITEFSGLDGGSYDLGGIAAGPDGNLWFAQGNTVSQIGRITPTGTITEFSAGLTPNSYPYGITAGPDGNMWFTESTANKIGRIIP